MQTGWWDDLKRYDLSSSNVVSELQHTLTLRVHLLDPRIAEDTIS